MLKFNETILFNASTRVNLIIIMGVEPNAFVFGSWNEFDAIQSDEL